MDKRKSRQSFNIVAKKIGNSYSILRYANGFSKEPVVLFKNILSKEETINKIDRAIKIISKVVSDYGVLIQPSDKSQMIEIAMVMEDSGISANNIRVQKNGVIYFLAKGDSDASVRANVEDILDDHNIPFNANTVTVTRPDLLPKDKEDGNKPALEYDKDDTVYLQTEHEKVDTSITSEEDEDELKKEAENILAQYKPIDESLSTEIDALVRTGKMFKDLDEVFTYLLEKGYDVEEVSKLSEDSLKDLIR